MDFLLMIEGQEGVTWPEWRSLGELAERTGYDGLFRSDHYASMFHPELSRSLDAWAVICALATTTSRIRLGTLVSPVAFRHPAVLANMVVTADQVSGGRVELGLGAGWYEDEHSAYGFKFPDGAARLDELADQLEIIHGIWTSDDPVGSKTRVAAPRAPRPVQRPHPPLLMGGSAGPRACALAARWADEYNVYETAPAEIGGIRARLAAACERIGRDPATLGMSVNSNVLVGRDHKDLLRRAERHMSYQGIDGDPGAYTAGLGPERMVGTPHQILEQVAAYREAGVDRIMLQVYPHGDHEAIQLIGEQIVARV